MTLTVLIGAHVESGGELDAAVLTSNANDSSQILYDVKNYEFMMSYGVELAVAWFLWYPIIETVLFAVCLGLCCPCIPWLAGWGGALILRLGELARARRLGKHHTGMEVLQEKMFQRSSRTVYALLWTTYIFCQSTASSYTEDIHILGFTYLA